MKEIKPVTSKQLADFLGVSESAVSQYNKKKSILMKYGLAYMLNHEKLKTTVKSISKKQQ